MNNTKIISLNLDNITKYGLYCIRNPKYEGFQCKQEWLRKRFDEGLKIKILYSEEKKKILAYIEYIPGEHAWRAISAPGCLVIHCLLAWYKQYRSKGNASRLIQICLEDAQKENKRGVAVVTSDGTFLAGKEIFLKNGFEVLAETSPSYQLLFKRLKPGPEPRFNDWQKQLEKYQGLNFIYADQCPLYIKTINEIMEIAKEHGLQPQVTKLTSADQAQQAPSPYGVFSIVYNGKLLADRYLGKSRFRTLLKKELG
ncbi:MAG TPA: GNAT family N-acetyltransferase [Anaerolineae bacterium]|nr:GNAT family N-acetyltransferase [Anaerolineae bacterium]